MQANVTKPNSERKLNNFPFLLSHQNLFHQSASIIWHIFEHSSRSHQAFISMSWAKVLSQLKLPVKSERTIKKITSTFACGCWATLTRARRFSRRGFTRSHSSWACRSAFRQHSWAITDGFSITASARCASPADWSTRTIKSSSSWTRSTWTSRSRRCTSLSDVRSNRRLAASLASRRARWSARLSLTEEVKNQK